MTGITTRGLAALAATIALSIFCLSAHAAGKHRAPEHRAPEGDDNRACVTTYKRALDQAQTARLRAARESFLACSRSACGELVRRDCTARYEQLGADIPSVVPLVNDDDGEPRVLVEVRIDGELVASRLDGRALPVDPGKHELSFSTDNGVFATRRLVIAQGERNRSIHVVLHPSDERTGRHAAADQAATAPPTLALAKVVASPPSPNNAEARHAARPRAGASATSPAPTPPTAVPSVAVSAPESVPPQHREQDREDSGASGAAYVFGTLGLVGVGGFALLTYWGRTDNNLLADCSPGCPDASVRHVRQLYWAADATLGVGVVALAVSTWLFASSGSTEKKPSEEHALRLNLHPTPAGAVAAVAGSF